MAKEPNPPPWQAQNARDAENMHKWCNLKLGPPTQRLIQTHLFVDGAPEPPRPPHRPKTVSPNLEDAVRDVGRIRKLWLKYYKKKNRHASDGPSAVEIAARRWNVDEAAIYGLIRRGRSE